jgi:hypothetical protein
VNALGAGEPRIFKEIERAPGGQRFPSRKICWMPKVHAPLWAVVARRTRPVAAGGRAGGRTGGRTPFFWPLVKLKQATMTDVVGAWAAPAAGARTRTPNSAPPRSLRIATFLMSSLALARTSRGPSRKRTRMCLLYTAKKRSRNTSPGNYSSTFRPPSTRRITMAVMSSLGSYI